MYSVTKLYVRRDRVNIHVRTELLCTLWQSWCTSWQSYYVLRDSVNLHVWTELIYTYEQSYMYSMTELLYTQWQSYCTRTNRVIYTTWQSKLVRCDSVVTNSVTALQLVATLSQRNNFSTLWQRYKIFVTAWKCHLWQRRWRALWQSKMTLCSSVDMHPVTVLTDTDRMNCVTAWKWHLWQRRWHALWQS